MRIQLSKAFPDIAAEIKALLREDGFEDLFNEIDHLEIVDICRCDSPDCATFYTAPKPDGAWPNHRNIMLSSDNIVVIDISEEKIVCVEMLERPDYRERLFAAFDN